MTSRQLIRSAHTLLRIRNQEVASEDPYINGVFGTEYTRGLQEGEDTRFLQAISTLKHWDAYSLEDADGRTRDV